jgi:hypothetical protein
VNGHVHIEADSDSLSSLEEYGVPAQPSAKALGKRKVIDEVASGRECIFCPLLYMSHIHLPFFSPLQNPQTYSISSAAIVNRSNPRTVWILILKTIRTPDGAIHPFGLYMTPWQRGGVK